MTTTTRTERNQAPAMATARLLDERELSRKSFLARGGGFVIGLSVAGAAAGAARASDNPKAVSPIHRGTVPGPPDPKQIDSWLQVNPDNTVTLYQGWAELGQGSPTAVNMIAAEELGLSFDQVHAVQIDTNVSISEITAGSTATKNAMGANSMRGAAAAARTLLLRMASEKLGVPEHKLSIDGGVVSGGGKKVRYADLMAGKLFGKTIEAVSPVLTSPDQFRIIGTPVPRLDIPAIVTADRVYIQNVHVPGMLHGRVVRPRGQAAVNQGAKILALDKSSVAHIPHVQVVRKDNFLGVVARTEWDAIRAAAELKVTWDQTPELPGDGNLEQALRDPSNWQSQARVVDTGDVGKGLASAAKTLSASYFYAYQAHAVMGPSAAVADVKKDHAVLLVASQAPYILTRRNVAQALGMPQKSVRIEMFPFSGTYGHSPYDDVSISVALLSQAVGKPVRLQFMRWDSTGWDQFGPAHATDVRAGIDGNGKIVAFDYTSHEHGWTQVVESGAQLSGVPIPKVAPTGRVDTENLGSYYTMPNRRVTNKSVDGYKGFLKGIWLRAPAAPQALFASEQMIDALAREAKMDPIDFRIHNIDAKDTNGSARFITVLKAVAKASGWKPHVPASDVKSGSTVTGRGVAMGLWAGSRPAVVADVTVNKKTGKITVDHLYAAQDAGITVNPASVENQMVGCLVQGMSRALIEEVHFNRVRQTSLDWVSYPALRFKDSPDTTVVVVQHLDTAPGGSGEPTTAPVAAAIANAFFDATGVRLYRVPMIPGYVRGRLQETA